MVDTYSYELLSSDQLDCEATMPVCTYIYPNPVEVLALIKGHSAGQHLVVLKVSKHEIFDGGFFA